MYKITWDKETGGVLLHTRMVESALSVSPRLVFYEELDLHGLDILGWKYSHCQEPLIWAINKQLLLTFEAMGANIYDDVTIVFADGKEGIKMNLKHIDMEKMLKRNLENMFALDSEAIEFTYETFNQYIKTRESTDKVAANQLDYEALDKRIEAKHKQQMAIVKEQCHYIDSEFKIRMPEVWVK